MSNLSFFKTPTEVVLAGNGIIYGLSTINALESEGTHAKFKIWMLHNWNEIQRGDYLKFRSDLFYVNFVFVDYPDNSGNQLTFPGMFSSVDDFILSLKDEIMKNYFISKHCYITHNINELTITFFEKGNFSLSVDFMNNSSVGLGVRAYEGQNHIYKNNYRICGSIFTENQNHGTEEKFPFPELNVEFDVSDYVRHLCNSDFSDDFDDIIVTHKNACIKFNVKFFEKYNSPPDYSGLQIDNNKYCLPGGIDKTMIDYFKKHNTNWFEYIINNKKFLTWADDKISFRKGDVLRLYFLLKSTDPVKFCYACLDDDGRIIGSWKFSQYEYTSVDYTVIECICDPDIIEIESGTVSIIYKLVNSINNNDISESRQYFLDLNQSSQKLTFVFANSYEIAYDTIFAYGNSEHEIEIENDILINIDKTKYQNRSDRIEKLTIRSGHITFRQLFYWQEFIQSNKRFLIRNGRRVPVRILSTQIFMYKNHDYNYGIEILIEIDNNDQYRSTLPNNINFSDHFNTYGFNENNSN